MKKSLEIVTSYSITKMHLKPLNNISTKSKTIIQSIQENVKIFTVLKVSRPVLVSRPTLLGLGLGYVNDSVLSLNDSRTWNKTISRPANVAYVMKTKYFCKFVILVMFRK